LRFRISVNGNNVFIWDSELGSLKGIDDNAAILPDGLEEAISKKQKSHSFHRLFVSNQFDLKIVYLTNIASIFSRIEQIALKFHKIGVRPYVVIFFMTNQSFDLVSSQVVKRSSTGRVIISLLFCNIFVPNAIQIKKSSP
jgi:hypothetical protein